MDAWYDGRREINIVKDGKDHYGKYIDGRIFVTNDDPELGRRTWILERYPHRNHGTPGHVISDDDSSGDESEPVPEPEPVPSRFTFVEDWKTWEEAQAHCAFIGMNLATILSPEENDEVLAKIGDNEAWIGLNDRDEEGQYLWISGVTPSYMNW